MMNFHNLTQGYVRPVQKVPFRQQMHPLDFASLYRKTEVLLKGTGKVAGLTVALVVMLNLAIMSLIGDIERSLVNLDNTRHTLIDDNIAHRAKRAYLNNPENLRELAHDKLSLNSASKEQIGVFDRKKGIFRKGQFDRETKAFVYL